MRFFTIVTIVAMTSGLVAAQPHQKHHRHLHGKVEHRDVKTVFETVYVLNGKEISEEDAMAGIKAGTLVWAENGDAPPSISSAPSDEEISANSTQVDTPVTSANTPISTPISTPAAGLAILPNVTVSSISAPIASAASQLFGHNAKGINADFPDGQLSCSDFPDEYGAMSLNWLGLGGWSGIQKPGSSVGGFSDISTIVPSMCSGGNCCSEGSYCSYACPPGYQKSQWPKTQGATGQSVGGLLCQDGVLHLTNSALSSSLCMKGSSNVNVQIENKMDQGTAVCRTDYPGTESETVPLDSQPGTTQPLTCPDASNYYNWQGSSTSAQYYVNNAGISIQEGCQWSNPSSNMGNYAPLNLGVGYSAGSAWLSIFQNSPTTNSKLDFTVELVGTDGGYSNLSGRCKYSNGQYCKGDDYSDCSETTGCTVSVSSGDATFVFS